MASRPLDPYESLLAVARALRAAKIPYAVCGGLALTLHGFVRATKDIDLIVRRRDVSRILEAVKSAGFTVRSGSMTFRAGTDQETRMHRALKFSGELFLMLDLLEAEPSLKDVWRDRKTFWTADGPVVSVSREALIRMKRRAGRPQDLADIQRLTEDGDEFRA